jgi:hypothetical protein
MILNNILNVISYSQGLWVVVLCSGYPTMILHGITTCKTSSSFFTPVKTLNLLWILFMPLTTVSFIFTLLGFSLYSTRKV